MDGRIVYLTTSLYLYSIPTLPITSIGTPSIPIYRILGNILYYPGMYTLVLVGSPSIESTVVGVGYGQQHSIPLYS
jgi:hypothetical protein